MSGLRPQPGINPVGFPFRVISNFRVTHSCQFTGSVVRGVSGRRGAINYYVRRFVRQKFRCQLFYLIRWQIDCSRYVRVIVSCARQCLHQVKLVTTLNLLFQLLSCDRRNHGYSPFNCDVVQSNTSQNAERPSRAPKLHLRYLKLNGVRISPTETHRLRPR